ncbi:hypothetical protein [Halalkalibacillus sediminis]|nr:hypothetical protein [Halalkalibacillus sediminis]
MGVLLIAACGQGATGDGDETTTESEAEQTEQEVANSENTDQSEGSDRASNGDSHSMDKEEAANVLGEYEEAFNNVINNKNDQGKQNEYETKDGLQQHFENFMTAEWATNIIDIYFEEKDDGLYVKAIDGPTFLQQDQEYSFTNHEDGTATVTQNRDNELTGNVEMKYELQEVDGNWVVHDVSSQETSDESNQSEENENTDENNNDSSNAENDAPAMSKDRAQTVLEEYEEAFKKVINYTDENGKQKEYTTKEGLEEHFRHFMSAHWAAHIVDTYFEERDDGLYVKETDGPIFLQEDQEFSYANNKGTNVIVTQERDNQLTGNVEMQYVLMVNNGRWIVHDVTRN